MSVALPFLGHGIGLRPRHFPSLWDGTARVDWFEAIAENYMVPGGRPRTALERARGLAPVVLHGVSLSLGSTDPLDEGYLADLCALADWIEPAWLSDHVCWSSVRGRRAHDLLPLPYTEEALDVVAGRVARVQDRLRRPFLIENVSSYLTFTHDAMPEWEFVARIAERAGAGILLDVNNVYVSARNHGFDPRAYLAGLPAGAVGQIHLAGHTDRGSHLLDTHDGPVAEPVWDLYREAVRRFGRVSTLIEWDDDIPELEVVQAEAERARTAAGEMLAEAPCATA